MIAAAHSFSVIEASHPEGPLKPARPRHEHHPFLRAIVALIHNR